MTHHYTMLSIALRHPHMFARMLKLTPVSLAILAMENLE